MSLIVQPTRRLIKPRPGAESQLDRSHPLTQGLVGAWLMNEGGGPTAQDLASVVGPMTLNNMEPEDWVATPYGHGLRFGGTNEHLRTPARVACISPTTAYTILIRCTVKDETGFIASQVRVSADRFILRCDTSDAPGSKISFGHYNGSSYNMVGMINVTVPHGWHTITATQAANGTTHRLWVDGVEYTENPGSSSPGSSGADALIIGGDGDGAGSNVTNDVDLVAVWDRPLSPSEIASLYANPYQMFRRELPIISVISEVVEDNDATVSDSITLSDTVSLEIPVLEISVEDNLTLSDAVVTELSSYEIEIEDNLALSDEANQTVSGLVDATAEDVVTLTDTVSVEIPVLEIAVEDSLAMSDEVATELSVFEIAVEDSLAMSDEVATELSVFEIAVEDSITLTDTIIAKLDAISIPELDDEISISDEVSVEIPILEISVEDSLTLTDTISAQLSLYEIAVEDSLDISDLVSLLRTEGGVATVYDSLAILDEVILTLNPLEISVLDSIQLTDAAIASLGGAVTIAPYFFAVKKH